MYLYEKEIEDIDSQSGVVLVKILYYLTRTENLRLSIL